jgi:hypothetical protein
VPWLLKETVKETADGDDVQFYSVASDGKSFSFHFDDPAVIGGQQYIYDSSSTEWNLVSNSNKTITAASSSSSS